MQKSSTEDKGEEIQKQTDEIESELKSVAGEDDTSQMMQKEETHPKPPVALRFGEEIQPM